MFLDLVQYWNHKILILIRFIVNVNNISIFLSIALYLLYLPIYLSIYLPIYSIIDIYRKRPRTKKQHTSLAKVITSLVKLTLNFKKALFVPLAFCVSMLKIFPTTNNGLFCTLCDQSSNISWVFNFCLKLSPSVFKPCPSIWFSQSLPNTSSTRLKYACNCLSIYKEEQKPWLFMKITWGKLH